MINQINLQEGYTINRNRQIYATTVVRIRILIGTTVVRIASVELKMHHSFVKFDKLLAVKNLYSSQLEKVP